MPPYDALCFGTGIWNCATVNAFAVLVNCIKSKMLFVCFVGDQCIYQYLMLPFLSISELLTFGRKKQGILPDLSIRFRHSFNDHAFCIDFVHNALCRLWKSSTWTRWSVNSVLRSCSLLLIVCRKLENKIPIMLCCWSTASYCLCTQCELVSVYSWFNSETYSHWISYYIKFVIVLNKIIE